MFLIKNIVKKRVASIPELSKLTVKKIFGKLSIVEEGILEESLKAWADKIDLNEADYKSLHMILTALSEDEIGKYDKTKHIIKKADIHYSEVYPNGIC